MNILKQTILLLLSVMLLSCSSDKSVSATLEQPTETELSFEGIGGTLFTYVTLANAIPELTSDQEWCVPSVAVTNADKHTIAIAVAENETTESRTAIVTISYDNVSYNITISQAAQTASQDDDTLYSLGLGWNLGNQLDAYANGVSDETCWGNPKATQELFDAVKKAGYSSVRIPITWMGHIGEAPTYTIDSDWMNRVGEIVGYAENAGLKAIINIHHDGAASEKGVYNGWLQIGKAATDATVNTETKAKIKAIWTQIAEYFKAKGNFLIFEGFNEIHDGGWGWGDNRNDGGKQYSVFNEWLQVFVDAVRATGGNNATRYLGIPGYDTDAEITMASLKLPTDPANHLLVAIHYYSPYEYTLENSVSQWGHTAASDKKVSYGDESEMKAMFQKIKEKYIDNNIPIYLGEFGCVRRSNATAELFRRYYLEYICKAAKTYNLSLIFWDNGSTVTGREASGLFNRTTGAYLNTDAENAVSAMIKGYNTTDTNYTLETVYANAPK